jgi:hypothetical protein
MRKTLGKWGKCAGLARASRREARVWKERSFGGEMESIWIE